MLNTNAVIGTATVKLTKKGATHMPRTAYNQGNWQAVVATLGKAKGGSASVQVLANAIMQAVPAQQPHMATQYIKYMARNGNLQLVA